MGSGGDRVGRTRDGEADGRVRPGMVSFGPFTFDVDACRLARDAVETHLTPKAAAVLCLLVQRPGELISKDEFLETVWEGVFVREESLTQAISVIRQALGDSAQSPRFIKTVSGEGYRFVGEVTKAPARPSGRDKSVDSRPVATQRVATPAHPAHADIGEVERRRILSDRRRPMVRALLVAASLAAAALLTMFADDLLKRLRRSPGAAFETYLSEWHFPGANHPPSFILSPDGNQLVYLGLGEAEGSTRLYAKELDAPRGRALAGTEGTYPENASWAVVFSPDSEWLAFTRAGSLWRMAPRDDAAPLPMCDLPHDAVRGATWADDGAIILGGFGFGLREVGADGNCRPRELTQIDVTRGESHYWPQVLPGGRHVLFNVSYDGESWDKAEIAIVSREVEDDVTTDRVTLPINGAYPRFVSTGHLLYARSGALYAVEFDAQQLSVTGTEFPVLTELVTSSAGRGTAQYAIADNGTLAWMPRHEVAREVVLLDREGRPEVLDLPPGDYSRPRFSPDGARLALIAEPDLLIHELADRTSYKVPVTDRSTTADIPLWLPGGNGLVISSDANGPINLVHTPIERGTMARPLLTRTPNIQYATSASSDGTIVLFSEQSAATGTDWDIYAVNLEAEREPRALMQSPAPESNAVLSPDGRYFAYASYEFGRHEIFVRPFDDPDSEMVHVATGTHPAWRGSEIFYLRDSVLMVADVDTTGAFRILGEARPLFEAPYRGGEGRHPAYYDVSPDGQQFAFVQDSEQRPPRTLTVELNWAAANLRGKNQGTGSRTVELLRR